MKTIHTPANDVAVIMPQSLPKPDASGTGPNRYATSLNVENDPEVYDQKPDNHTKPNERMLNPDRGEK